MNSTTTEATDDTATLHAWKEGIAEAFTKRVHRTGGGYELVNLTFDAEYLRHFDRVLDELAASDDRLPHHLNPERTLLRSAAVEVVVGGLLERRRDEGQPAPTGSSTGIADALTGSMQNIILGGFIQRFEPAPTTVLIGIELLLDPETVKAIDDDARRAIQQAVPSEDQSFYLVDGFPNVRSAFIEAGVTSWLILNGHVGEDAVQALTTSAQLAAQQTASRRRRWLRVM
jgi:hypothetical protein